MMEYNENKVKGYLTHKTLLLLINEKQLDPNVYSHLSVRFTGFIFKFRMTYRSWEEKSSKKIPEGSKQCHENRCNFVARC